jgi:DNA-binding transcriptional regulator YbjK
MQTSLIDQAHQHLARAWALLDRAEQLARQAARAEAEPSLWLLAANSAQRARDALEAIRPAAPQTGAVDALVDSDCRDLIQGAVEQLASIPHGHEPAGLSVALVHLAAAEHETGGRFCP